MYECLPSKRAASIKSSSVESGRLCSGCTFRLFSGGTGIFRRETSYSHSAALTLAKRAARLSDNIYVLFMWFWYAPSQSASTKSEHRDMFDYPPARFD